MLLQDLDQMLLTRGFRQVSVGQCSAQLVRCMASTSAEQLNMIKSLREQSGAPMADVRAALMQADWKPGGVHACEVHACNNASTDWVWFPDEEASHHTDEALQELRKKGLAASSKKVLLAVADGSDWLRLVLRRLLQPLLEYCWLQGVVVHRRPPETPHRAS